MKAVVNGNEFEVFVTKSPYPKCQRCRFSCQCVGQHPCFKDLCFKCASIVCHLAQDGKWLPKEVM